MNKKEISEIKKQFTPANCAITRLCGCYVDNEKERKAEFKEAFLSLPEEEMFKYFELFRKNLSGTLGKNLINMEFPLAAENPGSTHDLLMQLRETRLTDDILIDTFYDKVLDSLDEPGNFLILLIHGLYDIPGKSTDGNEMFDASEEVYSFVLCCVCPVKLTKAGLCYNASEGIIQNRIRDWVVDMPLTGFLFPAFNDRSTDIHSLLFYSKDADQFQARLIEDMLGCTPPMPVTSQKEAFQALVEDTLGDDCSFEAVKNIHEKLTEKLEDGKDSPDPAALTKRDLYLLLSDSGADGEHLEALDERFEETAGKDASLFASNVINARKFEIKTPDVVVQVKPNRADLVKTMVIDGQECLVIPLEEHVEVSGIVIKTKSES